MRRSTILSLPLQLVFPAFIDLMQNFKLKTQPEQLLGSLPLNIAPLKRTLKVFGPSLLFSHSHFITNWLHGKQEDTYSVENSAQILPC
jgi:hypothetical protein